jgi:hypothetical protein
MKDSELQGAIVLVRPDLKTDPAGQQGKIGVVSYASQVDDIYVNFGDKEGVYSSDALFKLKNRKELFDELMNGSALAVKDFKDLYKIGLLQDTGRPKDIVQALEIARDNPAIWEHTLEPTGKTLAQRQEQAVGR